MCDSVCFVLHIRSAAVLSTLCALLLLSLSLLCCVVYKARPKLLYFLKKIIDSTGEIILLLFIYARVPPTQAAVARQ